MNTREIASEYRLAHWAKIMRERIESGASIKAFCKKIGIHENTYFYWQKKLREAACEHHVKIQADSAPTALVRTGFAEVKIRDSLPQETHTKAIFQGNLSIEVSGVKIITDSTYPTDQLAYLLGELVKQC